MKKLLTSLAIAAASCVAATSAHALVLVLDNFNAPTPGVTIADWDGLENNDNSTADGSLADNVTTAGISAFVTSRNIRHIVDDAALIAANAGGCVVNCTGSLSSASIGTLPTFPPGQLNMANSGAVDSQVQVRWTLGPIVASGPGSISIDIRTNNPGTTSGSVPNFVEAFLTNGAITESLGNFDLFFPAPGTTFINLSAAQIASLSDGAVFRLDFQGSPEWDVNIDNLTLRIPEPGTMALVGAALLGLGAAARRRTSTKA
jgi:hypothetical protein